MVHGPQRRVAERQVLAARERNGAHYGQILRAEAVELEVVGDGTPRSRHTANYVAKYAYSKYQANASILEETARETWTLLQPRPRPTPTAKQRALAALAGPRPGPPSLVARYIDR
eukprot:scaffold10504_cov67-Phaeocystis_antarctica.AAC.3